jgi:3-hydroxyisobutyrate dehydrogenase-like beta-hydroxyacid dehydrogenase
MVGGDATTFRNAEPLLLNYARAVNLIGAPGSGQLTKMVNQICIGGLIEALAEALHFARRADLDIEKVIATISKGAAQSWQMENRWHTMVEGKFDFGFAVDWVRKDFALVFDEARRNGAELPVTALVDQFYEDVQAMGGGRWDTSSLMARLEPKQDRRKR